MMLLLLVYVLSTGITKMFDRIRGNIVQKTPISVVVDCNGIGFNVLIPLSTYEKLPETGIVEMYTHLVVKQDGFELYGFFTNDERELFRMLNKISSVGPKTALSVLSTLGIDTFKDAVKTKDIKLISTVKGIGRKTAERIIVDLKDTIGEEVMKASKIEAVDGLVALGFSRREAISLVISIVKENNKLSTEEIIKEALGKR